MRNTVWLFLIVLLAGTAYGGSAVEDADGCVRNLKNIDTALAMYQTDHDRFPDRLQELVEGGYLQRIPMCPAAGADTYSASYRNESERFRLCCKGHFHQQAGFSSDEPRVQFGSGPFGREVVPFSGSRLIRCQNNLKTLAICLEQWALDHDGSYPDSLQALIRDGQLQAIPLCPSAGQDSYSGSYRRESSKFFLCCQGHHHQDEGCPANRPAFDSASGLLSEP